MKWRKTALNPTHIFVMSRKMFAKFVLHSKNHYFRVHMHMISHTHKHTRVHTNSGVAGDGAAGGEWCTCHREQSPRGNKINILNEKLDFLKVQQILNYWAKLRESHYIIVISLAHCDFFRSLLFLLGWPSWLLTPGTKKLSYTTANIQILQTLEQVTNDEE